MLRINQEIGFGSLLNIALFVFAAASHCEAQAASPAAASSAENRSTSSATLESSLPSAGDGDWIQFISTMQDSKIGDSAKSSDAIAQEVQQANRAKDFYLRHPKHEKAKEARKLEAVSLVNAVAAGDAQLTDRMESTVRAVRGDQSLSKFDRAVVAGTYEFSQASKRISSREDLLREFEAVARKLIQEFPDQPQGYISLLTQALQRDNQRARTMVLEVVNSTAPDDVKLQARRLVTRFDLIGQPINKLFGDGKVVWHSAQPGLIYFWATWSPDSLSLADFLAQKDLTRLNVVAVCLDQNVTVATQAADAHKLPGQRLCIANDRKGALDIRLAANEAPLVYLVDSSGRISDVRGLDGLKMKLNALLSK